jgi:hypothetical protein
MANVTYFVALPFKILDDGTHAAGEAKELPSAHAAKSRANAMALDERNCGAVAFSRTGDPELGEFADAVVLQRFGDMPDDLNL